MRRFLATLGMTLAMTSPPTAPAQLGGDPSQETVVLLHGVWRRSGSMRPIERAFREAGYQTLNITYPSVTRSLTECAEYVAERVEGLEAEQMHFITHSMGALILRQMLADEIAMPPGRTVMIAPPNQGAALADHYSRFPGYSLVMGRAGLQLRTGEEGVACNLPEPAGEFAIIAGRRGHPRGWNPLIPGDDDGTVGVSETYLPGVSAFMTVRASHTFIMRNRGVVRACLDFVQSGEIEGATDAP